MLLPSAWPGLKPAPAACAHAGMTRAGSTSSATNSSTACAAWLGRCRNRYERSRSGSGMRSCGPIFRSSASAAAGPWSRPRTGNSARCIASWRQNCAGPALDDAVATTGSSISCWTSEHEGMPLVRQVVPAAGDGRQGTTLLLATLPPGLRERAAGLGLVGLPAWCRRSPDPAPSARSALASAPPLTLQGAVARGGLLSPAANLAAWPSLNARVRLAGKSRLALGEH